ncbi:type II secretion system protein [Curvibacter sp. HBC61]|uniref:Type II secretion system protein n=1 Tax=Curvibacter cyanobacteriorum TaxID=3026422 RepID=A0ABT5N5K6_9BURK|nr:type II secretion system protein [Curvibacter sp. HBC61]MDD0840756.1 type II secretion system protein [Curvibacter sp. HBC61]
MGQVRQRGMTLIELIVALVIVGVAGAGVLTALQLALRYSADPLAQRQALAIAESLMEEVSSRAFTDVDLHDPAAAIPNALGPEVALGESRSSPTLGFDNVDDYAGYSQQGTLTDAAGNAWPLTGQYATCVLVSHPETTLAGVDRQALLHLQVLVFGPGGGAFPGVCSAAAMANAAPLVRLEALRAKYDPDA